MLALELSIRSKAGVQNCLHATLHHTNPQLNNQSELATGLTPEPLPKTLPIVELANIALWKRKPMDIRSYC